MPKLLLLLLLITAKSNAQIPISNHSFNQNGFTVKGLLGNTKDTTVRHDSTIYITVKNIKPIPFDSAYKTPIRDTSVLVAIMKVDSSGRQVDKINCYWKKKFLQKRKWVCDTTWKKKYDTTTTLVLQPTKTLPRDTSSTFCCKDSIWFSISAQTITVIHDSVIVLPDSPITYFGIKLQSTNSNEYIQVARDSLHYKVVRPSQIAMYQYTGLSRQVTDFRKAGLIEFLTITAVSTAGSNIVEYLHGTDTIWYKKNLEQFAKDIQNLGFTDSLIAVIENEPINRNYYKGDFKNYIAQLRMSVEILHKYGIKTVSGCVHIALAEAVRTNKTGDTRIDDTRTLLTCGIPADFENTHDQWNNGSFSVPDWLTTVNWIATITGHRVVNGEVSSVNAQPSVWIQFMDWAKQAKMPYMLFWSGDNFNGTPLPNSNSKGDATNDALRLSNIGKAVRDYLK